MTELRLTPDIRWYIEALKKDRRRLTPEMRLELAAELIDIAVSMRCRDEVQRIRKENCGDLGEKRS